MVPRPQTLAAPRRATLTGETAFLVLWLTVGCRDLPGCLALAARAALGSHADGNDPPLHARHISQYCSSHQPQSGVGACPDDLDVSPIRKEGIVRNISQSAGCRADGGGVCYLVDILAAFLVPGLDAQIHGFLAILATIAEVWMLGYLLGRRVNVLLVCSATGQRSMEC